MTKIEEKLKEIAIHVGLAGEYKEGVDIVKKLKKTKCVKCIELADELESLLKEQESKEQGAEEIVKENFHGLDSIIDDKAILYFYKGLIVECMKGYAEDYHNSKMKDKIIKIKNRVEKIMKEWNFPNEHYIEVQGALMVCNELLEQESKETSVNYMQMRDLTDEEWLKLPKKKILQLYKNVYKMLMDRIKQDSESKEPQELFNRIEQCVSDYLKAVGSVDRKDCIEHDFRQGISLGMTLKQSSSSQPSDEEIEKLLNEYYKTKLNTDEEKQDFTKSVLKFTKWARDYKKD